MLKELGFPKEVIGLMMRPGRCFDLLTMLPKDDIRKLDRKGILFVAMKIESGEGDKPFQLEEGGPFITHQEWFASPDGKEKMMKFWRYFYK